MIHASPNCNLESIESPVPASPPLESALSTDELSGLTQNSSCLSHRDSNSLLKRLSESPESSCDRPNSPSFELLCSSNDGGGVSQLEVLQERTLQEQRSSCATTEDTPGESFDSPSRKLQEQQQQCQAFSRTSSLNAQAREFVPKNISAPIVPVSSPAVTPPTIHGPVPKPLRMPHVPSPPMFAPTSPIPRPPSQLGMFPPSGIGPSPPSIPGCAMNSMPMLGPSPALMNLQLHRPSTAPILPATFMMPSTFDVAVHPQSSYMQDSLVNQSFGLNVQSVQDGDWPHDLNSASVSASSAKPILTEDLKAKIIKQVEFYFSDVNLPTDNYLMKYVKRDPEGFVPISVLATFRKTRNLVKSHALLATALRSSEQLIVSDDGKKVRRTYPLPDVDFEEIQSRTVVAENLPEDHSISYIEEFFGSVGNVKMVRICPPEAVNGANQMSAKLVKTDMVISNKLHALIEYASVEQAERAVSELTDHQNWRRGLHVRLLLRKTFHSKHSHQQLAWGRGCKANDAGDGSGCEEDAVPLSSRANLDKVDGESIESAERFEGLVENENVDIERDGGLKRGRGRGRGSRGHGHFYQNGGRSHSAGIPHANTVGNLETKPIPGPRMPDGTRGFSLGRGRLIANT